MCPYCSCASCDPYTNSAGGLYTVCAHHHLPTIPAHSGCLPSHRSPYVTLLQLYSADGKPFLSCPAPPRPAHAAAQVIFKPSFKSGPAQPLVPSQSARPKIGILVESNYIDQEIEFYREALPRNGYEVRAVPLWAMALAGWQRQAGCQGHCRLIGQHLQAAVATWVGLRPPPGMGALSQI